jgi:hypothetical protein
MSEHKVKIIADSAEKFKIIEDKLKTLPEAVYDQIETAERGLVGIHCSIPDNFKSGRRIWFPKETTQIEHFEDYIGVYCEDFFFQLMYGKHTKVEDRYKIYTSFAIIQDK